MKITKRLAKEIHNEKGKSFDDGKIAGGKGAIEKCIEMFRDLWLHEECDTFISVEKIKEILKELKDNYGLKRIGTDEANASQTSSDNIIKN